MMPIDHVVVFADGRPEAVLAARSLARASGARLTVAAVAVIEDEHPGCCDTRSGVWNRMQRELAVEHLHSARAALGEASARFAVREGPSVVAALADLVEGCRCDLVLLPDERKRLTPWTHGLTDRLRSKVHVPVGTPRTLGS